MLAGIPGDRYGRRDSLRILAVLYVISALGCAFAWDWYSLVCFRFIGGLAIGGSSVLGPMYIAEVSPGQVARAPGGLLPVQYRVGNSARLPVQLPAGNGAPRRGGVALEARHLGGSGGAVFPDAVRDSAQPALAGAEAPGAGGARRCCESIGEENVESELQDIIASIDAEHGHGTRAPVLAGSTGSRFSWRFRSGCSTSFRASTRFCIT